MKTRITLVLLAALLPVGAHAQGDVFAIRGGTVHTMAGETIEGGTVILQDGRIAAVGADVTIPSRATVIEATGQHVYPGLFSAFSQLALREINAVSATVDVMELGTINPHLTAATAVHPASEHVAVTRANGVTHVVTAPSARYGGMGGQASAIHLDGWTVEEMLIEESVGIVLNWPSLQTRGFNFQTFQSFNRPFREVKERYDESLDELRSWLESAREYQRASAAGSAPPRDLRLEAIAKLVNGELPLLVLANEARDIRNAVEFAEGERLRMVLVGGRDAWQEKELLVEKEIPLLLRATQTTPPRQDDPYHLPFSAPTQLYEAGVRFAMTGWGSSGPNPPSRTLAYEAANAVKFGLPEDEAMRMITRYPAEILGLGDRLGTIEVGKIGNVIVTDGSPLQIRTQVLHVFIDGRQVSLDNKHRALYERYRARR